MQNPFDDDEPTAVDPAKKKAGRPRKTVDMTPFDEGYKEPENKPLEFDEEISTPDLVEIRRQRELNAEKDRNNHANPNSAPSVNEELTDRVFSNKNVTSPKMDEDKILDLIRAEEIEEELVRKAGRYIESVDNARPGVPFSDRKDERITNLDHQEFAVPLINRLNINSDGVTIRGGGIFDPGEGAQKPTPVPDKFGTNASSNPNDPRSENFLTCSNKMCPYRESCLRYRLKNRRAQSFPFFPESCRKDGIFINVNETNYTGYDNFDQLERGASGVTTLPSP